jgi:peptidyl-tRNA hydrolase, PTH1 family
MKLIVGLGNPEEKYKSTRHNVGFRMCDAIADAHGVPFSAKTKFKADIAQLSFDDENVLLVKPTTYYNEAGQSVRSIADFYDIATGDILLIHDELALPFATVRTRVGGSDAGNNGVKSVTSHVGPDTSRIRIGIYNELRDKMDDAEFVLDKFSKEESRVLSETEEKVSELIESFTHGSFAITTHTN